MKFVSINFILASVFFLGCQSPKPTVGVTEDGVLVEKRDYRSVVKANSIIFDTRSPFEYNSNRVPGSINLPITDFESSRDPLDSARRLSLYGVNPNSNVVIIGMGAGDEQKLAWEFIKLGVTKIETLKVHVFRLLNVKPEGSKANTPLWMPSTNFGELSVQQYAQKMESWKPQPSSRARKEALGNIPVQALRTRVLVVTMKPQWPDKTTYGYADHMVLDDYDLYDDSGLLNKGKQSNRDLEEDITKYDVVVLVDSSARRKINAYALVQFGAKSLFLAPNPKELY